MALVTCPECGGPASKCLRPCERCWMRRRRLVRALETLAGDVLRVAADVAHSMTPSVKVYAFGEVASRAGWPANDNRPAPARKPAKHAAPRAPRRKRGVA